MSDFSFVTRIQKQIEGINGQENPHSSENFVMPTTHQNALVVNQTQDGSDVAICLQKEILEEFSGRVYPQDFQMLELPRLSVLVEEVSHFNYFCEMSRVKREISPLDLEIQAEVDKFSFALSCLHQQQEEALADSVFDVIFDQLRMGEWVSSEDEETYRDAHQIARGFCRRVLREHENFHEQLELFRQFFSLSPVEKRRAAL